MHTTHTYQIPSSPWAGALDQFKRSQRWGPEWAGPLPAKNEQTNDHVLCKISRLFMFIFQNNYFTTAKLTG